MEEIKRPFLWAIIIILLLILLFNTYKTQCARASFSTNYLGGLWVGDPDFCLKAESGGILLYIDNPADRVDEYGRIIGRAGERVHSALMIIHGPQGVALEKCFKMERLGSGLSGLFAGHDHVREYWYNLVDADREMPIVDFMSDIMRIEMDPCTGTMCWYGPDDTLFLKAHKNSLAMSDAELSWEASANDVYITNDIPTTDDEYPTADEHFNTGHTDIQTTNYYKKTANKRPNISAIAKNIDSLTTMNDDESDVEYDNPSSMLDEDDIGIEGDDVEELGDAANTIKMHNDLRKGMTRS
jgi:hypothetical protein